MATLVMGLLLPFWNLDFSEKEMVYPLEVVIVAGQYLSVNLEAIEVTASSAASPFESFSFLGFLNIIYWSGVVFCTLRLGIGLLKIKQLLHRSKVSWKANHCLITTPEKHLPFSFFHFLFWSENCPISNEDKAKVLQHEQAHIRQWHSLDVLVLELIGILFWCSPLVYFYKNSLRSVHEYLADAAVLQRNSTKQYGKLLLRQSMSGQKMALANHFFTSQLKNRIIMMTKHKSQRKALLKYFVALPVLFLATILLTTKNLVAQDDGYALSETDEIFKVVEEMPRFPGCEDFNGGTQAKTKCANKKLLEFIFSNLKYPEEARKNGVEGMVVLKFIVDRQGNIQNPSIARSLSSDCDEEVLRVASMMPKWIAGKQKGEAVNVEFTLPVKFKLEDGDASAEKKTAAPKDYDGEVLQVAEQMPIFPGCTEGESYEERWSCGVNKLITFVGQHLKYPEDAKKDGVEGSVVVQFVVTKEGRMVNPRIVKSIGSGTDEEVMRVANLMSEIPENWTPGVQSGQNVAVRFSLPIKFKMNENDKKGYETVIFRDALTLSKYMASPNPTSGNLTLRFEADPVPLTLELLDMTGRVLERRNVNNFDGTFQEVFDLSKAAKGTVIIKVVQGGKVYFNKVVVQ